MAPAPSVTLPRDLRATSGLAEESCTEDAGDDARKERDEADDHRPVHRFEPVFHVRLEGVELVVNPLEPSFHFAFDSIEPLVDLLENLVDVVETLVDVLLEIVHALVGPCFPCHHSHGSDHT